MPLQSKIKILPENLANKIAAGEVVERPASVVKELVENAIDAEAQRIAVFIEKGGKQLIQVVDNGVGMGEEDIRLAFERHATSKIKKADDLQRIETLGFRGEALPSIASVSQVEIKSKTKEEKLGNLLVIHGGKVRDFKKNASNTGTSISVKNLFFNTPARRQFLRADNSESQQILTTLKRFFLAYPDIHFELTMDGKQIFNLKPAEINERVREIFGDALYKDLLPLSASLGGVQLSGFISRPDLTRKSRGWQYIFLNGRPIQARSLGYAIVQGYANLIPAGSYPVYCLFIDIDPALVDVNVHPAKMEVRFANERSIYYFFINSVQSVLKKENVIPSFNSAPSGSAVGRSLQSTPGEIMSELKSRKHSMARYSGDQLSLTYFEPESTQQNSGEKEHPAETGQPENLPSTPAPVFSEQAKFWQIHNRYILSEIKSGMVIIDQHVAHERVLYERILKVLNEKQPMISQKLLFPQKLTLNYEDFSVFKDIYEVLNHIGFSIKVFSGTTIVIEAMPADVKVGRESQILLDIIDYYRNRPLHDFNHNEKVAAAYACKNAVKSGETLSQQEMQDLVDQLFACESPFFCPHGRPVIVTMDLEELDRKFKRIT
ncbi:MAG TPA: DNA mismatch repair endonuclease MutL [Caldithrix abyssi]|uniref:DNA mismatch repair protein MutL n=1 Tax=Caldithrix abyssi TaxID=187145 RepID=A0A7V4U1H0_CALAY|nr:DNA mismatch repair endonuclease MutL [Caldithrix abyssi]